MKTLIGNRYGRLEVTALVRKEQRVFKGKKQGFIYYYLCECDCGASKEVAMNHLKAGKTVSCGCIRKEADTDKLMAWIREYRVSKGFDPDEAMTEANLAGRVLFIPLSKQILERDSYSCVWCDSNGKLNAHHIEKWSDSVEKRFDRTNLVCLCDDCHYEVHNKGRYHTAPNPYMSILLEGYAREIEAICMRVELT